MTNDTNDRETNQPDESKAVDRTAVPEDTEWWLATQVPFAEEAKNDLTSAIIGAVAETEGVSQREIKEPPLYEVLDVAALETAFFASDTVGQSSDALRTVEFMYRGHRIVVRSDAWVQIFEKGEP